jgi:MoxR-like ATPase
MRLSIEHQSQASPDMIVEPVVTAWSELKIYLDRRSKELSEEVRNYPTPIARCDEQLSKLIEQRAGAIDEMKLLLEAAPARSGPPGRRRLEALEAYLMRPRAFPDDELETALRSRLRAAVSGLRGKV